MLIYSIVEITERLTQMTTPGQAGVKAHLLHLVCLPHEEVNDSISYDTVGISLNDMMVAISDM